MITRRRLTLVDTERTPDRSSTKKEYVFDNVEGFLNVEGPHQKLSAD